MKYQCEIIIDVPIEKLVKLYENPDNLTTWMDGLKSIQPISEVQGQKGSTCMMEFQMGKRNIKMKETILDNNMPSIFEAKYETKGVFNIVSNSLKKVNDNRTRYISHNFFKFSGAMRLISWMMGSAFKKQTLQYMNDFKAFAEHQN